MNLRQFNPIKILNHWRTLKLILGGKNPPPISCEIDPSNLCNHDCIWCMYHDFNKQNNVIMRRGIMFPMIDELGDGGVKSVTFTGGGEPLMNPLTTEALYMAKKKKMDVGLVTNGGLMDRDVCKAIVDTCTFLRVSLDAATPDIHKLLHRPKNPKDDNFLRIIENVKLLISLRKQQKAHVTIGIAFLVHSLNYHEIYKASKLVKDIGADYIQIRPAFIPSKRILERTWPAVQKLIDDSLQLNDDQFNVFPILHRFDEIRRADRTYKRCLAHALLGVVGANATLYLCCQLRGNPRFSFGSLGRGKSFFDIWRSQKRQDVIKHIDVDKCPPCRYNKYNELLDYLSDKIKPHKNFL